MSKSDFIENFCRDRFSERMRAWAKSEGLWEFEEEEELDIMEDFETIDRERRIRGWRGYYEGKKEEIGEWEEIERGENGRTELHEAVLREDCEEISRIVSLACACARERDNSGFTPYVLALVEGKDKALNCLERLGIRE